MFNRSRAIYGTLFCAALLAGCGSGSSTTSTSNATLSLASSSIVVPQDGRAVTLAVTVTGATSGSAVTVGGLPSGITETFQANPGSLSGVLTFQGSSSAAAGNASATVSVTVAGKFVTQPLTIVSAPVASLGSNVETSEGVNGAFAQFMSTSFQIFQYTGDIFGTGATATAREQELSNLQPQHIRLQVIQEGIPMKSNTGTAADWDFTLLDQTVQPVLASADQSPEFQIASAPAWMCNSSGQLDVTAHAQDFAGYAANLVRYYNAGGFDWGGQHFKQPGTTHIQWWGIFNEPNVNGISAADYVTLYNTVVPAMLAVDPTLKFSALEFSDYGLSSGGAGDPAQYLPTFLAPPASGGVNAQVDVLSTHFYATCNQKDTDATLFNNVPSFAQNVTYFQQQLAGRGDLSKTQVWVTENNVNADFPDSKGMSVCNPGQTFVVDQRGSSAFFAAWRAYVFSQLAKAGNRALYHWLYSGNQQYGEVDAGSNKYLGYWVDRTLATAFATLNSPQIVTFATTDGGDIELLALRGSDGTEKLIIANHAVQSASDNNGAGAPRTVVLDTSQSGRTYSAASLLMLDHSTDIVNGPTGTNLTVQDRIPIPFSGYGAAIVTLTP
ncbi:MAG: hypothetical protein ACLGSD_02190 [Acidobacteriota bacterium]